MNKICPICGFNGRLLYKHLQQATDTHHKQFYNLEIKKCIDLFQDYNFSSTTYAEYDIFLSYKYCNEI